MLLVVFFLMCVASVPVAGGRLGALSSFRPRHIWTVFTAISLQVAIISIFPGSGGIYVGLHLVSYGFLLAFLVNNQRLPGLWIIGLGTLMNFVAIAINGGVMPATASALARSGQVVDSSRFANSRLVQDANLELLGDVFAIPAGFPFANVFSAGDVCIVLGVLLTLHQVCETRFFPPQPTLTPVRSLDGSI